jgi:AraC-like DNA-binding protein
MGEFQLEILSETILERFGIRIGFDRGNVILMETLKGSAIGYGHFEPLRHYAEVQLLMEPLPRGSGNKVVSGLSVDDLAAAMNLSRVQLYRKVKAISGSSPIELLRTARLNRGYQLLIQTNKTVSEIAYEIGFTAPSYFTRCFKNEFGISPSDIQAK